MGRPGPGRVRGKALAENGLSAATISRLERLNLLFEMANDPILVFHLNAEGGPDRFLEVNEAAVRLYGYSRSELLNMRLTDLVDRPSVPVGARLQELLETGRLLVDSLHRDRHGEPIPVEVNARLFQLDGRYTILSVVRDIRDRKRAEQELTAAHRRIQQILASISDGFVALDREWRFVYVNQRAAEYAEEPAEALLGKVLWEKYPQLRGTSVESRCRRAMSEGRPVAFEYGTPTRRFFEISIYPYPDGLCAYSHEVTEKKRADARVAAEHAITRILSGSRSIERAASEILEILTETLDAQVGELWLLQPDGLTLRCLEIVARPNEPSREGFLAKRRELALRIGEDIAGQAWQEGGTLWTSHPDAGPDPAPWRGAAEAGFHGAVGFPVLIGEEFCGAITLFAERPLERDEALSSMMISVGSEIGQFIERLRAEEEVNRLNRDLERKVAELETVLEVVPAGIAVAQDGESGKVTLNPGCARLFGVPAGVLEARPSGDPPRPPFRVFSGTQELLLEELMGGGLIAAERELEIQRRHGPVRRVLAHASPLYDENGRVRGSVAVFVDITERRLFEEQLRILNASLEQRVLERTAELASSERALREQTRILESILDSMAEGVVVTDARGKILVRNPAAKATLRAAALSISPADWPKGLGFFLPGGASYPPERLPLQSALRGECVDEAEVLLRSPGTERDRWLSINARPLLNREGKIRGAVAVFRDVTERKAAERKLHEYQQQLRKLTSELSLSEQRERRRFAELLHDHLQQHLVGARFALAALESRLPDPSSLSILERAKSLLSQSAAAARSLSVELSPPILYEEGLAPALEWLAGQMESKYGLSVELATEREAEPEGEEVRSLLFQAARELLFNIVKHAQVSAARVEMRRNGHGSLELTVSDDGVGFDPNDPSDDSREGFGLFRVRERLSLIGAEMSVASKRGRGTRIRILAPREASAAVS